MRRKYYLRFFCDDTITLGVHNAWRALELTLYNESGDVITSWPHRQFTIETMQAWLSDGAALTGVLSQIEFFLSLGAATKTKLMETILVNPEIDNTDTTRAHFSYVFDGGFEIDLDQAAIAMALVEGTSVTEVITLHYKGDAAINAPMAGYFVLSQEY